MCGICGIVYRDPDRPVDIQVLENMSKRIMHRGPDDEGTYVHRNIGLAVRRLSIIDILGGHQPIWNEDETVVVVYNGEIYNYQAIKELLETKGHLFKTACDTEILVHLYEEYGSRLVDQLNGMFAFAIYDIKERRLLLSRDRLGIKPIYYVNTKNWFLFSSEIKSFLSFPEFSKQLDYESLHHYLTFRFVPAPLTLFRGVNKLPPGFIMEILPSTEDPKLKRYWNLSFDSEQLGSEAGKPEEVLTELVQDAVKSNLISDVPLGAMLSGGIDSSALLSVMTKEAEKPISTFTIVYEEEGPHNEGSFARLAAQACQSDHHEVVVGLDDFIENLERMVYFMDEPIADPAAIPIYDLCRFSKEHVTVLLSGVGGDELFGGYGVYREAIYSSYLRYFPQSFWNRIVVPAYNLMPNGVVGRNFVARVKKPVEDVFLGSSVIYGGFSELDKKNLYSERLAHQQSVFNSHDVVREALKVVPKTTRLQKMIYMDTKHWLADSHLNVMDKMSMASSLEGRTPLLDHRLVEFSAALPESSKVNLWRSKIMFKNAFRTEIPKKILKRPKRGFSTPIHAWLNKPKNEFKAIMLNDSAHIREYFNMDFIMNLMERHAKGEGDFSASLFTLLVLEFWLDQFLT